MYFLQEKKQKQNKNRAAFCKSNVTSENSILECLGSIPTLLIYWKNVICLSQNNSKGEVRLIKIKKPAKSTELGL